MKILRTIAILMLALTGLPGAPQAEESAEKLMGASDCSSCHAVDREVVGPAYGAIAKRYAGQADAAAKLATKIREGGGGMTPHPDLTEAQRADIAKWILSQKESLADAAAAKLYPYKLQGRHIRPIGFSRVCGGQSSEGNQGRLPRLSALQLILLPLPWHRRDRRTACAGSAALAYVGMKQQEFLSVAMAGKNGKRYAGLGRIPQRGRCDSHLQVRKGTKPRSGAFGQATVRAGLSNRRSRNERMRWLCMAIALVHCILRSRWPTKRSNKICPGPQSVGTAARKLQWNPPQQP